MSLLSQALLFSFQIFGYPSFILFVLMDLCPKKTFPLLLLQWGFRSDQMEMRVFSQPCLTIVCKGD